MLRFELEQNSAGSVIVLIRIRTLISLRNVSASHANAIMAVIRVDFFDDGARIVLWLQLRTRKSQRGHLMQTPKV